MTPRVLLLAVGVALSAAAVVAWSVRHAAGAVDKATVEASRHARLVDATERLHDLESQVSIVALAARPAEDVQTPFVRILDDVALEASVFRGIEATEDRAIDEAGADIRYRRQSMVVRLRELPLADIGAVIAAWRERAPAWTISRLELQAPFRGSIRGTTSAATAYAATMTLTAVYVDEEGTVP